MRVPSACGYDFSTPTASIIASLTATLPYPLYTICAEGQSGLAVTFCSQLRSERLASGGKALIRQRGEWLGKTIAQFGEMSQLRRQFTLELLRLETPPPVAAIQTGSIHAGLATKPEHILQGNNAHAPPAARINAQWMPSWQRPT